MRRLRFLPALLLILSACSENIIVQNPSGSDQMGSVSIALTADMRNEVVASKAEAEEPVLDDFIIEIYRTENQKCYYKDSYANTERERIDLPYGGYKLHAYYGEALGWGFGRPYYLAEKDFEVKGTGSTVSAVAKLENVRIAVEYDYSILDGVFEDYYAVVHHASHTDMQVEFSYDETRYGYLPAGKIFLEVCTMTDGKWTSHKTEPETYDPNDFITFNISSDAGSEDPDGPDGPDGPDAPDGPGGNPGDTPGDVTEGNLLININVKNDTESLEYTVEIPAWAENVDRPIITLSGFDVSGNVYEIVEGISASKAKATFIARGGLSSAFLRIQSDFLDDLGVPTEVDFADLTLDEKNSLSDAGFDWTENIKGTMSFSEIDFTGVIRKMQERIKSDSKDVTIAEFFLEVKDTHGVNVLESFKIVSVSVQPSLTIEDYNVWATRIVAPVTAINKGDAELVKLQMSSDKVNWSYIGNTSAVTGNTVTFGSIQTTPGTSYHIRAIYNGNEACVSPVRTVRTEDAAKIGNSGFEDWTEKSYYYDQTIFDRNNNFPWYQPWSSDQWWDTNATNSMKDDIVAAYTYFRLFPCVQYSVDAKSGSRSAQLVVVNVGGANHTAAGTGTSGTWHVGELFLGRGNEGDDGSWQKVSDGHAFTSRPTAVTFWYEYVPYSSSDRFGFEVTVKAADGTVLGTQTITPGSSSDWQQAVVEIPYSVVDKKAASIHMSFKASVSSSHDCKVQGEYLEVAGNKPEGDAARIKLSATLRVDDVQLVY